MTKIEEQTERQITVERVEFILYINNKIICQRYVGINNFNEDSIQTLEMKELMDNIAGMNNGQYGYMGIIPAFLKKKSINYLFDNYRPHQTPNPTEVGKNMFENEDKFQFEIKLDKVSVAKSEFSANWFPTEIRYRVNIREIIPDIMSEIRYYLSQKKYHIFNRV